MLQQLWLRLARLIAAFGGNVQLEVTDLPGICTSWMANVRNETGKNGQLAQKRPSVVDVQSEVLPIKV